MKIQPHHLDTWVCLKLTSPSLFLYFSVDDYFWVHVEVLQPHNGLPIVIKEPWLIISNHYIFTIIDYDWPSTIYLTMENLVNSSTFYPVKIAGNRIHLLSRWQSDCVQIMHLASNRFTGAKKSNYSKDMTSNAYQWMFWEINIYDINMYSRKIYCTAQKYTAQKCTT